MRQWLSTLHLDADLECDIVLASYEALANAVEHAYPVRDESATVDLEETYSRDDRYLKVRVADRGYWCDAADEKGPAVTVWR
jgi:serine/threonine-protein kinase RsbW